MKITATQFGVLAAAAARTSGAILPVPARLRGGAIAKVCDVLKAKDLAVEIGETGQELLVVSDDGRRALGLSIQSPLIAKLQVAAVASEERAGQECRRCDRQPQHGRVQKCIAAGSASRRLVDWRASPGPA